MTWRRAFLLAECRAAVSDGWWYSFLVEVCSGLAGWYDGPGRVMTVRKGRIPLVDPQPLDVPTLLAGAALVMLLAALGWYAYARGTRHGDDEPHDPPGAPAP